MRLRATICGPPALIPDRIENAACAASRHHQPLTHHLDFPSSPLHLHRNRHSCSPWSLPFSFIPSVACLLAFSLFYTSATSRVPVLLHFPAFSISSAASPCISQCRLTIIPTISLPPLSSIPCSMTQRPLLLLPPTPTPPSSRPRPTATCPGPRCSSRSCCWSWARAAISSPSTAQRCCRPPRHRRRRLRPPRRCCPGPC